MRVIHLGLILFVMIASVQPAASQGPQARSKAEYDAYVALYNETDPTAKAALGESFVNTYPDSEFLSLAFMNLLSAYEMDGEWPKVLATAIRFESDVPNPDDMAQNFVYPRGLMAAQMQNDVSRIIEFGNLLLEVSPDNLGAMLTLGSVYMDHLPTTEPARGRALAEAYDLANRARVQAQAFFGADASRQAERTQVEITIHTTLARVHYARADYQRAADEYQQVIAMAPKDGDTYYRLGDCYQFLAFDASGQVEEALAAQTAAQEQGRDDATIEQLKARYDQLQATVLAYLDRSIDYFATATAIGGAIGPDARSRLESLYLNRNENSLDGLDELLQEKEAEVRAL